MGRAGRSLFLILGGILVLTLSACGGGSTNRDFSLSFNPTTVNLTQGQSANVTLTVTAASGAQGSVAIALTGLPTGVTASPAIFSVDIGSSQQIKLSADEHASAGNGTITATGTSGLNTHTATVAVAVAAPPPVPDFSLNIDPRLLTFTSGSTSDAVTVSATAANGFTGTVNVALTGLPTGVTANPASLSLTPGVAQKVTFSSTPAAPSSAGTVTFTGTSGTLSHTATLAVVVVGTPDFSLAVAPTSLSIAASAAGLPVSVSANGVNGFVAPVSVSVSGLPSGVTATPSTFILIPGTPQTVTLAANTITPASTTTVTFTGTTGPLSHSAALALTVTTTLVIHDVTTYHYDTMRTGLNANEQLLTPASVNSTNFGKIAFNAVDGKVDAQPLYLTAATVGGQVHNVLYVATENDSVYAFDADKGGQLWKSSVLGSNETPSGDHGCFQITPEIGITSTPVIDRKQGANGTIFVVAMSKDANNAYHQRLHALDLTTGAEQPGSPTEIQATYPGTGVTSANGVNTFDPSQYAERAGLLLLNGNIYMGFTSHCDAGTYTGWLMAYSEATLQQTAVLNLTPNGSEGSIWMSGAGLAAETNGFIYLLDANGTFDTTLDANGFPVNHDFGNSLLKISTANGTLGVADYFEPFNGPQQSVNDQDLGSGGAMVLPDISGPNNTPLHIAVGAGKDGNVYFVNRDNMGKFNASTNNIYAQLSGVFSSGGIYGAPAYFNGSVYYGGSADVLKAFQVSPPQATGSPVSATPTSTTTQVFQYPGATPSVSANGTQAGIVWALESNETSTAVLHAYDATNLATEFYNSNQAANGRDTFGNGNKFITPVVANGKVYVGTQNGVAVFGVLTVH